MLVESFVIECNQMKSTCMCVKFSVTVEISWRYELTRARMESVFTPGGVYLTSAFFGYT